MSNIVFEVGATTALTLEVAASGPAGPATSFVSIASLRASDLRAGAVTVQGYYAAGDAGAEWSFTWSSGSTATDDGFSVIKPTAVSGAGRWLIVPLPEHDVRQAGCKADGVTGNATANTAAINTVFTALAARTRGGTLLLSPGVIPINGAVTRLPKVNVRGCGGGLVLADSGSVLQATNAAAVFSDVGSGGFVRDFYFDGNSIATNCIVTDVASSGGNWISVHCAQAVSDNWIVKQVQNCSFIDCESNSAGRDNLVLDRECGGLLFLRFESVNAVRHSLKATQSATSVGGYSAPSHITFLHSIFENFSTGTSGQPPVRINLGASIGFENSIVSASYAGMPGYVDIDAANATFAGMLLSGGTSSTWGVRLTTSGTVQWDGGFITTGSLTGCFDIGVSGGLQLLRPPGGTVPIRTATGPDYYSTTPVKASITATRPINESVITVNVPGEGGERFRLYSSGQLAIGSGSDYNFTTTFDRDSVGNARIGSPGGLKLPSYTTAGRPSAATVGAGVLIYDSTLGYVITSNGSVWKNGVGTTV